MRVTVVACGMSLTDDATKDLGVELDIFSNTKKTCFGVCLMQTVEHERRDFGMRAVVEAEIDFTTTRR